MPFFCRFASIAILFCMLISSSTVSASDQRAPKNILVIIGLHKNQLVTELVENGIEEIFRANHDYRIEQYVEYLDLNRFSGKQYREQFAALLSHKYADRSIDVIITIIPSGLAFLLEYGDEIFPDVPIVFSVVSEINLKNMKLSPNITGISYKPDIKGTLETALKLQPHTKHVVVIGGVSKTNAKFIKGAKAIFDQYDDKLKFTYLTKHSMSEILEQVAHLPEDTIILYTWIYKDREGNSFIPREAIVRIVSAANVPSYSLFETFLGQGIVGGNLIGFTAQGRKAAEIALRILNGEKLATLPVSSYGSIVNMFDWRELKRWGISEGDLPPGSIVHYKELTTWGEYKWYIIWGSSLFIFEAILILLLLFNWARRLKAESALRKSHKELEFRVEERTTELSKTNEQLKEEIKERRRAEEALRNSNATLELAQKMAGLGYWSYDVETEMPTWSREMYVVFGVDPEQGQPSYEDHKKNWHPDDWDMFDQAVQDAIQLGKSYNIVIRIIFPDHSIHYVNTQGYPRSDENGKITELYGASQDITETMRKEEERKQLQDQLHRAQKMEALGLMAGGIAHDLNNILSGIVTYPELLLMELPEESPLRRPIKTMQESGMRAVDVVADLMTIVRGVATGRETLKLNTVVEEYLSSAEHEKLKTMHSFITFKTVLDSDLLNISGSPTHIEKTLMNLVVNASEAIEGRGTVTISSTTRYLDAPLKGYENIRQGEYAVLSVLDEGTGISPEDLERIFEPFYTKKVMGRSGTGLGLAIVWNTVQDHNGYINVISSEKGTEFELYFPVTREEVAAEKEEVPLEDYLGHGEKILVVDDEERQREIACGVLAKLGYNAEAVSSGEEAIEYVKAHPVDLILLDMVMPKGINGRKTYEEIIKIRPGQKAIIASGHAKSKEVDLAQELGAGKYIMKPYTLAKVGIAVKKELEK